MGAATVALDKTAGVTVDGKRSVTATVTLSASYATGGDTLAITALGLSQVDRAEQVQTGTANTAKAVRVDTANPVAPKVLAFTGAVQDAAASNQSTTVATLTFVGS